MRAVRVDPPEAQSVDGSTPVSAARTPRNRLVAALRRLTDVTVGRPLAGDALSATADRLEELADDLERRAGPKKRPRGVPDARGHPQDLFPTSPVIGYANPLAPPARIWAVEGDDGRPELRGRVSFGYAYEGPPTCVHGGVIAQLFDELLGATNIVAEDPGMTGTLTIRYRRPTPLLTELHMVGRQTGVKGRKIFTWGGLYHEGELTAEADGVFIQTRPKHLLGIVERNARHAEGTVVDPELQGFVDRHVDPPQGGN